MKDTLVLRFVSVFPLLFQAKISLLAKLCYGVSVPWETVPTKGISKVAAVSLQYVQQCTPDSLKLCLSSIFIFCNSVTQSPVCSLAGGLRVRKDLKEHNQTCGSRLYQPGWQLSGALADKSTMLLATAVAVTAAATYYCCCFCCYCLLAAYP